MNNNFGEVITMSDYSYDIRRQVWNRAIQKYPFMIVYPKNVEELKNAVLYAVENKFKIRVRNGGHSYEGFSVDNDAFVIDMANFNQVVVDVNSNTVYVEGGAKNHEIYNEVIKNGYVFPGGDCPDVGGSGYTLSGGWSFISRTFGLGIDNLKEIKMLNYKGEIITANEIQNKDLFWALRGVGGSSYGIVVSMTFNLPPKIDQIILINLEVDNPSDETQKKVFEIWQSNIEEIDNKLGINISFRTSFSDRRIIGTALFIGDIKEASKTLDIFNDISGIEISYFNLPYRETIDKLFEGTPASVKLKNIGLFVNRKYNKDEIENIFKLLNEKPNGSVFTELNLYSFGGKISEKASDETSFYYRKANYLMALRTVWNDDFFEKSNIEYINRTFNYLKNITIGNFVGNPYIELHDYETAYYQTNKFKLKEVKKEYDPYDYFKYEQSIKI